MKRFFAEYKVRLRKTAKKLGVSVEQLARALVTTKDDEIYGEALMRGGFNIRQDEIACGIKVNKLEARVFQFGVYHYFVETERLSAYLPTLLRKPSIEVLNSVLADRPSPMMGILHTCGSNAVAILFAIEKTVSGISVDMTWRENVTGTSFYTRICSNEFMHQQGALCDESRLLLAMALYIQVFPHALIVGIPPDAKQPNHYKGPKCATIREVPQIISHNGPIPHLRSGHFRTYADPRFVNVRGQTIWVEDCVVKGAGDGGNFTVTESGIPK